MGNGRTMSSAAVVASAPLGLRLLERSRGAIRASERLAFGTLGVVTLLTLWEIGARTEVLNALFFSSPSAVTLAAQVEVTRGTIWAHVGTSLSELVVGIAIAGVIGIFIGFCAGWFRHANYVLDPWITVLYSTPKVALVPLIILVLGIDFEARVVVVALMGIFSIIVNTMIGVQSVQGGLINVARSFGASQPMQWRSVVFPASLPFVLTGLRLALGHGMVGVLVAEFMSGSQGIGVLIKRAAFTMDSGTMIFGIVLIGTWGILSGELMRRVERQLERWRPE